MVKISNQCLLETEGYQVSFELHPFQDDEYVNVVIEFQLNPLLGEIAIKSVPTSIAISDLLRLIRYLEDHINQLKYNPDVESDIFVPIEIGFQAQALSGEVRSERDGEFSLRFMINVGAAIDKGCRVYIGGESIINLEHVSDFILSLRIALAQMPKTQS